MLNTFLTVLSMSAQITTHLNATLQTRNEATPTVLAVAKRSRQGSRTWTIQWKKTAADTKEPRRAFHRSGLLYKEQKNFMNLNGQHSCDCQLASGGSRISEERRAGGTSQLPRTPLRSRLKMSAFSEAALEKKLSELSNSQQSVQTLSLWLIHHRKHSRTIVGVWLNELKKGESARLAAPRACSRWSNVTRSASRQLLQFVCCGQSAAKFMLRLSWSWLL